MHHSGKIRGIFTPNVVLLNDRGGIHERELRRYVDWLIAKGVHGLYPNGSTGEFLRFTPEERQTIMEIVADQTAGRVPILAGAAESNVRETLRACEAYHRMGARAVAIVSPFYYRLSPRGVYQYFKQIADESPIDVTLYNIPMFASPIDVATVRQLAEESPRIVGIKDSSGDVSNMMRMIAAVRPIRPDFSFLTGWDPVLLPMMLIGCDGGTHATSGVVPELTRALFDAASNGDFNLGRQLQFDLLRVFDAMISLGEFPMGFAPESEREASRPARADSPSRQSNSSISTTQPKTSLGSCTIRASPPTATPHRQFPASPHRATSEESSKPSCENSVNGPRNNGPTATCIASGYP